METKTATPLARIKPSDAEKITINLGYVDLGQIDLLVTESFYSNRTDFIRTAIRNQLAIHGEVVKQAVARKMLVLGLQQFTAADLEACAATATSWRSACWGSPPSRPT